MPKQIFYKTKSPYLLTTNFRMYSEMYENRLHQVHFAKSILKVMCEYTPKHWVIFHLEFDFHRNLFSLV